MNNDNNNYTNSNIATSVINKEADQINTINLNSTIQPTNYTGFHTEKEGYKQVHFKSKSKQNILFFANVLLLFIILFIIINFFVYPKYKEKVLTIEHKNDTEELAKKYTFKTLKINDNIITFSFNVNVDNIYKLNVQKNNNKISVFVNEKYLFDSTRLYNEVGLIDDHIVLLVDDLLTRTTVMYIVNKNGDIIKKYDYISESDLKIDEINNAVSYNENELIVNVSKVDNNNLYHKKYIYDICDDKALNNNNISDKIAVQSKYIITYLGNGNFSQAKLDKYVSLLEYKSKTNICN